MTTCDSYQESLEGPCSHYIKGGFCRSGLYFRCVEFLKDREPELSYSSIRDFSICRRKFWWSYIVGLEQVVKPLPLMMGSYVDQALQQIHTTGTFHLDLNSQLDSEGHLPANLEALQALMEAYCTLPEAAIKGETQKEFHWHEDGYPLLHGFLDLYIKDKQTGAEFKYTGNPDAYSKFTMQDQLSTYFIGIPDMQRVVVRTIQVPQLRLSKKETNAQYHQRVYDDVLSRPKHYLKDTAYYRNEFDLTATKVRALQIWHDIQNYLQGSMTIDNFFQTISPASCFMPSPCFYLSVCESGVVSDTLYRQRIKQEQEEEGI